jgi:hypothetical protein
MSIADLEKQLAELQAEQKEYRQNYRNVVGPRSAYDIADYNYAVLQFRRKYGPDNYFDRIRASQQRLDAARKAATTPPPAPPQMGQSQSNEKPFIKNVDGSFFLDAQGNKVRQGTVGKFPPVSPLPYPEFEQISDFTSTDPNMITTDTQLQKKVSELAAKDVPTINTAKITPTAGESITTGVGQVPTIPEATASGVSETGLTVTPPTMPGADVGQIGAVAETMPGLQQIGGMEAAQLTPTQPYVDMTGVEGVASAASMATAAQAELDPRATVQYQLGQLMSSLEEGKPMPAWASPQVRKVNAIMQSRGLGASSMAAAAITQSLMESGVQIAAADANKYAAIQLQNLDNRQKAALQNAATVAAMDRANLSARLQGAVTEAQALLSVDLKNLDNKQKADTLNFSVLVQGLFKDAAEENARKQFNAKNELQVEEFFAELGSQVETATANRVAATRQFNVSEANAMAQFNQQVRDSRDKFNGQMQFAIDQSNAVWRREINTANTAAQNETNRLNAQMQYNATQTALASMWQMYRDNASWNFTKSENELQRKHQVGLAALEFSNTMEKYDRQQQDSLAMGIGNFLANLF